MTFVKNKTVFSSDKYNIYRTSYHGENVKIRYEDCEVVTDRENKEDDE